MAPSNRQPESKNGRHPSNLLCTARNRRQERRDANGEKKDGAWKVERRELLVGVLAMIINGYKTGTSFFFFVYLRA